MRHAAILVGAAVTLAALAVAAVPVALAQAATLSVRVGTVDEEIDSCPGLGRVTGLNPAGDNFLAVRAGPGTGYPIVDRLHTGDLLNLCERVADWEGVVYPPSGSSSDCGVDTPLPLQDYSGPCRSGWVFTRFVDVIAG